MADIQMEQAPRKAKEHFDKGFAAFERANYDYAMDFFQLALEVCPNLTKARKFLRMAQVRKIKAGGGKGGGLADALSSLSGIGATMSVNSLIKKDPAKAVIKVEELLRKNPLNLSFVKLAVEAALAAKMPEAAVVSLEAYIENKPGDVDVMRQLGKLLQDIERFHEAKLVYEEIAKLRPTEPQAIKNLKDASALDSMQRGKWEDKGSFHEKLKDKKEAVSLEREAKAVKSDRDILTQIEETKAKTIREPANINYQRTLAKLYLDSNQFDEGIAILEKANQATGGGDAQIDRALSEAKLRKMDFKIAALREAGKTAEADAMEEEKAGFVMADAEDRVRRYPNDLSFKYELGVLQYEHGLINEAVGQFQLSQRNPQRRIRSLYYMALCFSQKGQNDIAAEQLTKAKSELQIMDELKKDIVYELGCIYEAAGEIEKAIEQFKEIYSVDIGFRDIAQKIEKHYKK